MKERKVCRKCVRACTCISGVRGIRVQASGDDELAVCVCCGGVMNRARGCMQEEAFFSRGDVGVIRL